MVHELMGIINLGENEERISELTHNRPIAAIPFAGRFRVIDFMLSNMVNSGIGRVTVMTKNKFYSLIDHIGPGKYWDLDRKSDGLRMIHPYVDYTEEIFTYGDLDSFRRNIGHIEHSKHKYVLLTRSYFVGNISFKGAFRFHRENEVDITYISKRVTDANLRTSLLGLDVITTGEDGEVAGIGTNLGNIPEVDISLEMMIINKDVLVEIIKDSAARSDAKFLKQAIVNRLNKYKTQNYNIEDEMFCINSTQNYFKASMELLNKEFAGDVFSGNGKIFTKIKDAPPTVYRPGSSVKSSLVANGSIIEGTVENSIIFRDVKIEKGAVVRNSIIFQGSRIGKGANLNFIITDKNVKVSDKKILMGDGGVPYVIGKGMEV